MDLYRARERYCLKLRAVGDDSSARKPWPSLTDKCNSGPISNPLNLRGGMSSGNPQTKKVEGWGQVSSVTRQRKDAVSGSDSQYINQSGLAVVRKKRVHAQVSQFYKSLFLLLSSPFPYIVPDILCSTLITSI